MKKQIRTNVFETNSSSVHSLTIVSYEDYEKWKNGELVLNYWDEELVPITNEVKKDMEENAWSDYCTYDKYEDRVCRSFESFEKSYTTKSGDEIVAFGYYGHD